MEDEESAVDKMNRIFNETDMNDADGRMSCQADGCDRREYIHDLNSKSVADYEAVLLCDDCFDDY